MKKSINLSHGRKRVATYFRQIFYISVGLFCLVVLITIGLTGYKLVQRNVYSNLEITDREHDAVLTSLKVKREKYIETQKRLVDIQTVIAKRPPTTVRLATISEILPGDATVDTIAGTEEEMDITINSESLSSLSVLLDERIDQVAGDKKKGVKKVEMKSFGLNPKTLLYSVSLRVTFN